jgi:sugar phosphate isomerase/epimerase
MRLAVTAGVALLALALTGAGADEPTAAAKRDDAASEKLGIKLSLQCWTFNKLSFVETVDKAKGLGVKYVEMFPGQKFKPGADAKVGRTMDDATKAAVKQKLAEAGIKLVAYGVDGVPTDEAGARKAFEWAKEMGIEVLVTETTPNEIHDKLTQEFGIKMALHNHPQTWPPEKVLKACENRNKLIGSCSDTGHWMRAKLVPAETLRVLQGRVLHLHFKDLNEFGNGHDVAWGTGKGDPRAMLAELQRQGFRGYTSIEFEYGDLKHLDENLPKCVAFFDKVTAELAK